MTSIDDIRFDTTGWTAQDNKPEQKLWVIPEFRDILSLHYFPIRPDIPFNLADINTLRDDKIESLKAAKGELVEMSVATIDGVEALYQILKFPMYEDGRGRVYVASWIIPFAQFSYVIKVQCVEIGVTGLRENMVFRELFNAGKIKLEPPKDAKGPVPMPAEIVQLISKMTDDVTQDAKFPDHPVSRARRYLEAIKTTLTVTDDVRNASPFRI